MRRLTIVLLGTLLVSSAGVPVAAQEPAEPEMRSHRVVLPEIGAAITFPPNWRVMLEPHFGPSRYFAGNLLAAEMCTLYDGAAAESLDEAVRNTIDTFEKPFGPESVSQAHVELSVGPGVRVDTNPDSDPAKLGYSWSTYHFVVDGIVAQFQCRSLQPPDDLWADIADSLEPLANGDGRSDDDWTFDSRIEMPHLGFAVDFPADWMVARWVPEVGLHGGENVLTGLNTEYHSPRYSECLIEDHAEASPPGTDVAAEEAWRQALIDPLAQKGWRIEADWSSIELPAGRTYRIDWQWRQAEPLAPRSEAATTWAFSDAGRRFVLVCKSENPPSDRWLSIAETFEFLPADAESQ